MRGQISAFFAGAISIGIGLVMAFMIFIGPNSTPSIDPVAAWCRGWIDGLSYTDFRSGNDYEPATLDEAEEKCYSRYESGLRAPASRGPLTADDPAEEHP
jgi:hypothetical protein